MNATARHFVHALGLMFLLLLTSAAGDVGILEAFGARATAAPLVESSPPSSLSPNRLGVKDISSQKFAQFVEAYQRVSTLTSAETDSPDYTEINSRDSGNQDALDAQVVSILVEVGLSEQEYRQLATLANSDPEFSKSVAAQIQDVMHP
ncbi:MAG: hypothetical protein ACFB5Z_05990 [Elainellaceae cyanobacterium]